MPNCTQGYISIHGGNMGPKTRARPTKASKSVFSKVREQILIIPNFCA